MLFRSLLSKYKFKIFIVSHYGTYLYENNYYIFMKKYGNSMTFIDYKNVNEFKNLIQQCLLFCLFLNFKIKIFHNDLHLRNCLFKNINDSISIKFEDLTLEIKDKLLVVIDFFISLGYTCKAKLEKIEVDYGYTYLDLETIVLLEISCPINN